MPEVFPSERRMELSQTKFFISAALFSALLTSIQSPAQQTLERKEGDTARTALPPAQQEDYRSTYVLGWDDQITIRVLDVDEIGSAPMRIDSAGDIRLPYVGRMHAAGLTVEQLRAEVTAKLKTYMHEPDATVFI